jgi:hypothetical protein
VRPILELLEDRLAPATFTTTTATDFVIPGGLVNPATGQILSGPGMNQVTLRSAIQAANLTPPGSSNTINLQAPGPYLIQIPGANEDANQTGDFDIAANVGGDLTITNTSGSPVTVDGGGLDRVFDINPTFNFMGTIPTAALFKVTFQGFTIQNGKAVSPNPATNPGAGSGGGIRSVGPASVTLNNMTLTNNTSTNDGAGISMENAVSTPWTLTILSSVISNNKAGDAGGGVETDGHGTVVITDSQIFSNTSVNQGGGVWLDAIQNGTVQESATASFTAVAISGNFSMTADQGGTANVGGGIGNAGDASNGKTGAALATGITITECLITGNGAAGDGGGFGDQNNQGSLTVTNSIFNNNNANFSGGAIFASGVNLTVTGSTFTGNMATTATPATTNPPFGTVTVLFSPNPIAPTGTGGAIWSGDQSTTITQSTFQMNSAKSKGGGLFVVGGGAFLLKDSTVTGNTTTAATNNAPDVFGQVSDIAASTGNTIGITDANNTNLSNGLRALNFQFNTPLGLVGVFVDQTGNVFEIAPAFGARVNVTKLLNLGPSLSASGVFTNTGQILVMTQQDGTVLQLTVSNGQGSLTDVTATLGPGKFRAASVALINGVEFLVATDTAGNVNLVVPGVTTSPVNLTSLFNLTLAQTATLNFNPFNSRLALVVDDVNGGVTELSLAGMVNLGMSLGTTPSKTTSLAFPGAPTADTAAVVDINEMGDLVVAFLINGIVTGPFNLGPNAIS